MVNAGTDTPLATPAISTCHYCGTEIIQPSKVGRPKRFCSDRCRRLLAQLVAAEGRKKPVDCDGGRSLPGPRVPAGAGGQRPGREGPGEASVSNPDKDHLGVSAGHEFPPPVLLGTTQSLSHPPDHRCDDDLSPGPNWAPEIFASPAERIYGDQRIDASYKLRQGLRLITSIDRCKACGRDTLGGSVALVDNGGVGHFAGLETCGRVWTCPVCGGKIRARRGEDIAEGVGMHLARGGGALFLTATLPHDQGDALALTLDLLVRGWKALWGGKAAAKWRKRLGILGNIKSIEITVGHNGWHPHIHAVIILEKPFDELLDGRLAEWVPWLKAQWDRFLLREGWRPAHHLKGIDVLPVSADSAAQLAAYVTKIQDGNGGKDLGNEMARADLKRGRKESRTPLEVLRDFLTWGDAADLALWLEYEQATAGKSAIRWSKGLRALLLPNSVELTDEEIAAEEVGGDVIGHIKSRTWYRVCETPGAEAAIRAAIGHGGMEAVIKVLLSYRLGRYLDEDVLIPEQWNA